MLRSIRNPEFAAPNTAAIGATAGSVIPTPEACACKKYTGTKPGEHHSACQYATAWKQSRGTKVKIVGAQTLHVTHMPAGKPKPSDMNRVRHQTLPGTIPAPPRAAPRQSNAAVIAPVTITVPSPNTCVDCKDWTKPKSADPNLHHPICQHFDAWNRKVAASATPAPDAVETPSNEEKLMLYDLTTKQIMREASNEEISEAREQEKKTGAPIIRIDEKLYGVVPAAAP